jgi:hypothetical protein
MQVDEAVAWRGGRLNARFSRGGHHHGARACLSSAPSGRGVQLATAALTDPLIGARFLLERPSE